MKKIGRFYYLENATDINFLKNVSPTAKAKVPCYVEYNSGLGVYLWIGNNIIKPIIEKEIEKLIEEIENYPEDKEIEEENNYLIEEYKTALKSGL